MWSSFLWDVTQCRLVVTDVSGQPIGPIFRDQLKDSYRRFGTTYRSHLQGSTEGVTDVSGHLSVPSSGINWRSHRRFGTTYRSHLQGSTEGVTDVSGQPIGTIFRDQLKELPTFRDNLSVPSSGINWRSCRRFGTTYR